MTAIPELVIYGASGHSATIALSFAYDFSPQCVCDVVAFIDDYVGGIGKKLKGRPVISFEEWQQSYADRLSFVAVAEPGAKRRLAARLLSAGGRFAPLYDRVDLPFRDVSIGASTWIAPPLYIGPDTVIGDHVQIMPMCSVGHDVTVRDFVTVCPSCTISGHVIIEEEVFLGAGSTIVNGSAHRPLIVGRNAKIAAGSVVTKSVPAGAKLAGNPARPYRELLHRLRFGRG